MPFPKDSAATTNRLYNILSSEGPDISSSLLGRYTPHIVKALRKRFPDVPVARLSSGAISHALNDWGFMGAASDRLRNPGDRYYGENPPAFNLPKAPRKRYVKTGATAGDYSKQLQSMYPHGINNPRTVSIAARKMGMRSIYSSKSMTKGTIKFQTQAYSDKKGNVLEYSYNVYSHPRAITRVIPARSIMKKFSWFGRKHRQAWQRGKKGGIFRKTPTGKTYKKR